MGSRGVGRGGGGPGVVRVGGVVQGWVDRWWWGPRGGCIRGGGVQGWEGVVGSRGGWVSVVGSRGGWIGDGGIQG